MTIENELKNYIIDRYGSILQFAKIANLPHSTIYTILRRGIMNSTLDNILQICKTLNIDPDELANEKIVPAKTIKPEASSIELLQIIEMLKNENVSVTVSGTPLSVQESDRVKSYIQLINEIIKKERK